MSAPPSIPRRDPFGDAENPSPADERPRVVPLADAQARKRDPSPTRPQWLANAVQDERGKPLPILANVTLALRLAPELREAFSYDELQRMAFVERGLPTVEGADARSTAKPPRPLTDTDVSQVQEWLQRQGLAKVGRETVHQGVLLRAQENAFHPVREYLDGLTWDGVPRLGNWLATYLGAIPSDYVSRIGRWFMISAAARVMQPGCKADYVLVLEGPQGVGKSQACAILGGPWFSDSLPDVNRDKDAAQHMRGKWLIEISELSAIGRAQSEALKSFISRPTERYRPPYGREEVIEPRQCVFIGTTNRSTYLGDDTGARRFWPVRVSVADLPRLKVDRDQLWAEALAAYRSGAQWFPDAHFERIHIRPEQEARFETDAWETTIAEYLRGRERVQVTEIAHGALFIETAKIRTKEQRRIAAILTRLEWTPIRDWRGRGYVQKDRDT